MVYAPYGEKSIQVTVYFWTDDLASTKGEISPGHGWAQGVVQVETNDSHDIHGTRPIPFNRMSELTTKIEEALEHSGVRLHQSPADQKLYGDSS